MQIRIRVYGHLNRYLPERQRQIMVELEAPIAVDEVLNRIGLPAQEVWIRRLNRTEQVYGDRVLQDGDQLELFPLVAGG